MSAKFLKSLSGLLLVGSMGGGAVNAETLSEVLTLALQNDAQYQGALHGFEAALEKIPQARAGLLPTVGLTANRNRQGGQAWFDNGQPVQRWVHSQSKTAQLTQPLFRWGNWASYQQADAQVRQAEAQLAMAEQDLLLRVLQTYLDVVVASHNLSVAERQVQAMNEQMAMAERHFKVGLGVVTDVHEAKAKWLTAQAQQISAFHDLASKRAELERVAGQPVTIPVLKFIGELEKKESAELQQWLGGVPSSPLVRMQTAALEVAKREVEKNKAGHLPTLDLTANRSYGYNAGTLTSPADITTETWSNQVGFQLNFPVFSGGGIQSKVREATALMMKAKDDLLAAERSAQTQVRQSYAGLMGSVAQTRALGAAVEAANSAVTGNKLGFKVGTRINTEVLNAEQQYYGSLRDLAKASAESVIQEARLKSVLGMLSTEDVVSVERLLAFDGEGSSAAISIQQ